MLREIHSYTHGLECALSDSSQKKCRDGIFASLSSKLNVTLINMEAILLSPVPRYPLQDNIGPRIYHTGRRYSSTNMKCREP